MNKLLVLYSDNASVMRGGTMLSTTQRLGVISSFSRPQVSDDNPYSEAIFRILKYRWIIHVSHLQFLNRHTVRCTVLPNGTTKSTGAVD